MGTLTRVQALCLDSYDEAVDGSLQALTAMSALSSLGLVDYKGSPVLSSLPIARLFICPDWGDEPRLLPNMQACASLSELRIRLHCNLCLYLDKLPAWPQHILVSIQKDSGRILAELDLPRRISVQLVHKASMHKLVVSNG